MDERIIPSGNDEQNQLVTDAWNQNAAFWDEKIGEGNEWHLKLVRPAVEKLLDLKAGMHVLDAACGNGVFARRMADLGASVVAFDVAPTMIERAKARSADYTDRIEYKVLDATSHQQLLSLGSATFDAIVCNMGFMDIANIEPLIQTARDLIKPTGSFVFSMSHPCFNSNTSSLVAERSMTDGSTQFSLRVTQYKQPAVSFGEALYGQPAKHQLYFDRPLEQILGSFFEAGFVLDGLLEPAFEPGQAKTDEPNWLNVSIPPLLVARMRS